MKILRSKKFWLAFAAPNLLSIIYFGYIAAPEYVSTASLTVYRETQQSPGIIAMLSGATGGGSLEGGYVLRNYIQSWDEYSKIDHRINLVADFSRGDFVSRYGGFATLFRRNDVALWHYYQAHVDVAVSADSGIVSLYIDGYSPSFTARLGRMVLKDAIAHIDAMNRKEEQDFISRAVAQRCSVHAILVGDEQRLAAYRARIGIYDPKALYVSELSLLDALKEQKAKLQARYMTVASATPNNPVDRNLREAIAVIAQKIAEAQASFSRLSREAAHYEPLVIAEKKRHVVA